MKKDTKKGLLIFLLLVILVGYSYYRLKSDDEVIQDDKETEEKDDKEEKKDEATKSKDEESSKEEEPKKESKKEEEIYKTSDGKYALKIVDKNDKDAFEKAKKDYEKANDGNTPTDIVGYAYLNDKVLALYGINKDELYASFSGEFPKIHSQYNECFLVDVKKKLILEKDAFNPNTYQSGYGEYYDRFNGEARGYYHVKNKAGYFFKKVSEFGSLIYTTSWKELGYLESVEESGIRVCNDYVYCTVITLYDASGNKLEENKNDDFLYKTKDNKYSLRLVHEDEIKDQNVSGYSLYAYFNGTELIGIEEYIPDTKYTLFKGKYLNKSSQYSQYYLVDNDSKELIKNPFYEESDGFKVFNGENSSLGYINTQAGYYFTIDVNSNVKMVFTTSGKKLGYTKEIKADKNGISLYDNKELSGNTKKYDVKGNEIK